MTDLRAQLSKLAEAQKAQQLRLLDSSGDLVDFPALLAEFDRLSKRITELEAGLCELLDEQVICDEPFDERFCSAHGTKHCHMRELVPRLRALLAKQARQARGGGK